MNACSVVSPYNLVRSDSIGQLGFAKKQAAYMQAKKTSIRSPPIKDCANWPGDDIGGYLRGASGIEYGMD